MIEENKHEGIDSNIDKESLKSLFQNLAGNNLNQFESVFDTLKVLETKNKEKEFKF